MPPEQAAPQDDAFAAAFAEQAGLEDAAPPADDAPPADAPPAAPPADAPPATPPADAPPAPPADAPPATPPADAPPAAPPADAPPAAPPAPTAEEIVKGLTEALAAAPPAPPAPPAAPPPAEEAPPLYTPEETQIVSDYEKNWPDVSRAETLKRRAEYNDLIGFTLKSVADWLQPRLAQLDALGNVMFDQQLKQTVPDYSLDLEKQVSAWVDTQPTYLQGPMKQVMQSGTSDEVADLIGRYRAATGAPPAPAPGAPPSPPAPAVPPAAAPKAELSSAAKQAAESLAPVSGDRSVVPAGEDPQDYETSFQKFAAADPT